MLRIPGKASSIKARKVLWTCAELDIAFARDDRGPELALNPNAMVPVPVLVDGDLGPPHGHARRPTRLAGAHAAGAQFTLADVVLGLSLNRWLMTPIERPDYPALRAQAGLLRQRPGCRAFGMNGIA
jgi:glutathione S-transferase